MTNEEIIEQLENSFNEYKGSNEAILDAAFYISIEFSKLKEEISALKAKLEVYRQAIH